MLARKKEHQKSNGGVFFSLPLFVSYLCLCSCCVLCPCVCPLNLMITLTHRYVTGPPMQTHIRAHTQRLHRHMGMHSYCTLMNSLHAWKNAHTHTPNGQGHTDTIRHTPTGKLYSALGILGKSVWQKLNLAEQFLHCE